MIQFSADSTDVCYFNGHFPGGPALTGSPSDFFLHLLDENVWG